MTKSHKNLPKSNLVSHLEENKYDCNIDKTSGFAIFKRKPDPYNWKIHLSVAHDQLTEAFELIYKFLEKFPCFKVLIAEVSDHSSLYNGKQFTLYLDESFEVNIMKLEKILNDIHKVLLEKNIKPGIIPKPDAPLLREGDYFSLRNDGTKTFNYQFRHDYYFEANAVGAHYNPLNEPNPYKKLLTNPAPTFDLVRYFNGFEPHLVYDIYKAMGCTCIAFLNASLSKNESLDTVLAEVDQAMSGGIELGSKPMAPSRLVAACLGLRFTDMPEFGVFEIFTKLSFSDFYKKDDQFGEFLKHVDKLKNSLPRMNKNSVFRTGCSMLCFGDAQFSSVGSLFKGIKKTLKDYEDLEKYLADKKQTTFIKNLFTPKLKNYFNLSSKKNKNNECKSSRRKSF